MRLRGGPPAPDTIRANPPVTNARRNSHGVVPDDASGTLAIRLQDVTIRENGLHGILINDQAEYFNDPASTSEEGSPASLLVDVIDSRFERNGFTLIDSDGLRINEGGEGTLEPVVRGTQFVGNGSFAEEDLDDGIDVDEGGAGDLVGRFNDVVASRNFEQGVDLNENDGGDLRVTMADVRRSGTSRKASSSRRTTMSPAAGTSSPTWSGSPPTETPVGTRGSSCGRRAKGT